MDLIIPNFQLLENKSQKSILVIHYIKRFLRFHGVKSVDGILADLGVSSHQFDVPERGFSTRFDDDLDMRMSKKNELDAFKVVNEYDESNLKRVFLDYG